ncbi:MAG: PLP-dependent aminotransferase family protein [Actinobacteria bacterium]|nr:MAG: PLP-dependent aminotransferase family protein [Actinomycetota bacterium]
MVVPDNGTHVLAADRGRWDRLRGRSRRNALRLQGAGFTAAAEGEAASAAPGAPSTLGPVATIALARGIPAPECLPVEELADCARAAVERDGTSVLSYGPVGGYAPLREWIAERHGVAPERVLLTNGSLQGFVFLAQRFAGARVLVEQPTYDRPLKILRALGTEVVQLPMDDQGLDPDAVADALANGPRPAFLYTIPTFQNPSGRTLSTERRRRLVEIARDHQLLVLEDDPYGLVRFEGTAPPSLFELEGGTHVAYSSSFSKTIAPGLRVGYFILPPELERELEAAAVATYITPVLLGQATVYEFLRRGNFDPNLRRVQDLLRLRRDAMLEALEAELSGLAEWRRPEGGYFLWLDLPQEIVASDLLANAEEAGVTFVDGRDFGGAPNTARLAYSYVSPDEVREGVRRLAAQVVAVPA